MRLHGSRSCGIGRGGKGTQAAALTLEAEQTEHELAALARSDTPALAQTWASLVDRALALDEDARLQVRQLVADTFERLVLYVRGARPSDADDAPIELLLISRAGQARMLTLDRWAGELLTGDHVAVI